MKKYAAGIVTYNPEIERLRANLNAVTLQVDCVYCFDNGSSNLSDITTLLNEYSNVMLIDGKKNLGIATALNRILQASKEGEYEWLLTLDQDSVICNEMINKLSRYIDEENVIIVCPLVQDIRRKNEKPVIPCSKIEDVDFCITSGSFMNIARSLSIGAFDEVLFIGLVDNDFCMRAKYEGYRIIMDYNVILDHQLGDLTPSKFEDIYLVLGNILHSETIKKLSYKRKVNPMRLYYATRNMIYMKNKYVDFIDRKKWDRMIVKNSISNFIRGGYRLDIIKAIFNGVKDGRSLDVKAYTVLNKR